MFHGLGTAMVFQGIDPLTQALTSLSDVAEMNTVSRGPESPPTTPHIPHDSGRSWLDHHVECCTKVVARAARACDWERLSGRRQFACKDSLATIEEPPLVPKASKR